MTVHKTKTMFFQDLENIFGNIHSIETCGTVDGPGIRFVVFTQGCPMRCLYCHNPDTWNMADGKEMSADEILQKMLRNKAFYTKGGITATGGEPMMQMDFLIELFTKLRNDGVHTCLDSSGIMFRPENPDFMEKMEKTAADKELLTEIIVLKNY